MADPLEHVGYLDRYHCLTDYAGHRIADLVALFTWALISRPNRSRSSRLLGLDLHGRLERDLRRAWSGSRLRLALGARKPTLELICSSRNVFGKSRGINFGASSCILWHLGASWAINITHDPYEIERKSKCYVLIYMYICIYVFIY